MSGGLIGPKDRRPVDSMPDGTRGQWTEGQYVTVLWIRIRSEPKLFAGSGSGIFNFGSGSNELQFGD